MQIRYRRASLIGLLSCLILLVLTTACQQQQTTHVQPAQTSPAAAVIGGTTIYESDIDDAIQSLPEAMHLKRDDPRLRARVLQVLIRRQAMRQQAIALHLEDDPFIRHRIAKARNDILIESLQDWEMHHIPEPTDSAIEAYYQAHLTDFTIPAQVHARHILVNSKQQAEKILKQLHKGADFSALAAEYSRDEGTKARGGDLNWFPRGVMVKAFEDAAFALKNPGDISPPVHTQFGWHIIQLVGKRPASRESLAEAKSDIVAILKKQTLSTWVNGLAKTAGAKILNPQYTDSPAPADTTGAADATPDSTP